MKIAPEPNDAECGFPVVIPQHEAERENLRILSESKNDAIKPKPWIVPAEEKLELLFFRKIFTELISTCKSTMGYMDEQGDDNIPIEMFQRAFERLFYVLNDEEPFDAQMVDKNRNGLVGWGEFAYVFKQKAISINLSIPERIYLTFDDPDSSKMAKVVSSGVLLTIITSSTCFILSTTPEFQDDPIGLEKPKPKDVFNGIENICLLIFVVEYFTRLFTCWAVRDEAFDRKKLLDVAIGSETIQVSNPFGRLCKFVFAPSNLIDFVAIAPGIISFISLRTGGKGMEGGAFVVLRLIRLTRMLKNPMLVEPVIVIARTISNSTKALYVLGFNLLLGILIFGSLMWVFEKGEWNPDTRTYHRYVGETWNATANSFDPVLEQSPFLSIPHAFWWAVVTAMTVGYGDMFPTTSWGYIVATATMVFSLVILALPVGVIGGNFSAAWTHYETEKLNSFLEVERDKRYITSAIQRIEPFEMSRLMLIEVWNERCPIGDVVGKDGVPGPPRVRSKPDQAEFLGQVSLRLEMPQGRESTQTHTLTLRPQNSERGEKPKHITGSITVQYEWKPMPPTMADGIGPQAVDSGDGPCKANGDPPPGRATDLQGRLKVTLIGADKLLNLIYQRSRKAYSNPYVMIFLYPNSPVPGEALCPCAWRSPSEPNTLNPRWNASHTWDFLWLEHVESPRASQAPNKRATLAGSSSMQLQDLRGPSSLSDGDEGDPEDKDDREILKELQQVGRNVSQLCEEMRAVNGHIFHKIETMEAAVEPFAPPSQNK